jgi:ACS family hexuronate transporter-like MFS transporter
MVCGHWGGTVHVRWRIALLLCVVTTINYLDRQALAVTAPVVVRDFGLSNTLFGAINSAFLFAYALGHVALGPVIDRLGTRRALAWAVGAWSAVGALHALARGPASLFGLRTALGFVEATNFPAAVKAIAEWFPLEERTLAVGIVTVGPGLGAVIAPPLLGWITMRWGWPWAFVVPGLIGFAWLVVWLRVYGRAPPPEALPSAEPAAVRPLPLGALRRRAGIGLLLSRFANDGAFYFFVTWLPLYLVQARGFDLRGIAAFAWIPYLFADVGSLVGGWAGRTLIGRGLRVGTARQALIWAGAIAVTAVVPAASTPRADVALGLIAVAMFAIQFKAASLFALPADLFAARQVGAAWGWFGAVGSLGGMLFVAAAGWMADHYAYTQVFWAVGVTQLLSAALASLALRAAGRDAVAQAAK